jgi:transposase-like protein
MAGKLTEEQKQEIVRRYQAGEGVGRIASALGVNTQTVRWHLRQRQVVRRSMSDGLRSWHGLEIADISPAGWWELYWAHGSGYPSMAALARRFSTTHETIRRYLARAGIKTRSRSEQQRIALAQGLLTMPDPKQASAQVKNRYPVASLNAERKGKPMPREWVERMAATKALRAPVTQPCAWCGVPVTRAHNQPKFYPAAVCCRSHHSAYMRWKKPGQGDKVRPLIVDHLRDLLRQHPYKTLPRTRETLEKAGATIGAGEAEMAEVMALGWPE